MKDYSHLNKECVAFNISKLHRSIISLYNHVLIRENDFDLTIGHFNILLELTRSGPRVGITKTAYSLGLDRSTLIRTSYLLLEYGYVLSSKTIAGAACIGGKLDARRHHLTITEKGVRILEDAIPAWRKLNKEVLKEADRIMGYNFKETDGILKSDMISDFDKINKIVLDMKESRKDLG